MIVFTLLVILTVVIWTTQYRFRRRRLYQLASKISHPKDELPFIGVAHKFLGNTEDIMTSLKQFSYEAMETNGVLRAWMNHVLLFVMVNPADSEMVLKTCMEKDDRRIFMQKLLGNGNLIAPVPIWRRRRKILAPAFSPKIVEGFMETFSAQSQIMTQKVASKCGPESVDIWPIVSAYSLDAICESTAGVKINAQSQDNSQLLTSLEEVLNIITERVFHVWLHPEWLFRLSRQYAKFHKCIQYVLDFTNEIIRKKRLEIKINKQSQHDDYSSFELNVYKKKTFLELLIYLSGGEKGYTDVELREEILTVIIAGTDTSAVAMAFTLILLGKYPDIQQQVYEELKEVFGDSDRQIVKEDLSKLKYLERVIKESLRLFPPAPMIVRKVETEVTLPSGLTLPSDSGVLISIFGIHRDPKYWGLDAEHFDPNRFLPGRFNLQHACSYMPFSFGPRNCVGSQYALLSIKTVLSSILRNYKVIGEAEKGPVPNIRLKLDVMMKAVDGFHVKLEKRKTCLLPTRQY